jgi:exosome complex component RRP43
VELPPLCSSRFKGGPPGEQAQVYNQFMAEVIANADCVDLKQLVVAQGKLVWVLYGDMICLDYDGSILDACIASLFAALKTGWFCSMW